MGRKKMNYIVDKITSHKIINGKLYYKVKWKNYSAKSDSWEPANSFRDQDIITDYEIKIAKSHKPATGLIKVQILGPATPLNHKYVYIKDKASDIYYVESVYDIAQQYPEELVAYFVKRSKLEQ